MDDENQELDSGLSGLGPEEEEGEETASITAAATLGALPIVPSTAYSKAAGKYEKYTEDYLSQIRQAREKLERQPTQKTRGQYLRGLARALTAPREPDDPRFYERGNLYTFLRDVGEYGTAQEEAEKKAKADREKEVARLRELEAKYGSQYALEAMKEQRAYDTAMGRSVKAKGPTARIQGLIEEAKLRGMTVQDLLKLKDKQREKEAKGEEGLSPADIRSIRLEVASTLSGPKDRLTIINEGLRNLSLAIKGNPQAEAQLNRSLATISGDKQLSLAEVESVVGAGSFAQRVSNAISKFFTGGAGDLTNEQKKELLETYEAYYANQYNSSRNRLKNIYIGAGYTTLPEDMFDSPYISVDEKRRRKAEEDAKAEKRSNSESAGITLSTGKSGRQTN